MPDRKVIVIGELNVDLIALGLEELPKLGYEVLASGFQITLGSASAIFACGMSRLGHPVTFISQVGDDQFGEFCLGMLRRAGVQTDKVNKAQQLSTGITIALSTQCDRALVTYLGAIAELKGEQIPLTVLDGHNHLHMTSYFLQQKLQPFFPRIFMEARKLGMTTSFDPNSDPAQSWQEEIMEVIAHTDILFVNELEAKQLSRREEVNDALQVLGEIVSCVVIKLGSKGAIAIRGSEIEKVSAFQVEAVDTTGAGDSFAAGFVHGFLEGRILRESLVLGNACGALSTLQAGGTAGQPDSIQLNHFLHSMKR